MRDAVVGKIYSTSNYSKFKYLDGNRKINKNHKKRLIISMGKRNLKVPIIVNEKMQLIDGQHRLEAARDLKLPICYQIISGLNLKDVQLLNTNTSNWNLDDYMDSYIDLGLPDYEVFKTFMKKYEFAYSQNFTLLNNGVYAGSSESNFKKGLYKISANQLAWAGRSATKIRDMNPFWAKDDGKYAKNRWFIIACCRAFKKKTYSQAHMLKKLKASKEPLRQQASIQNYTRMLEDVYFFRTRESERFRLD